MPTSIHRDCQSGPGGRTGRSLAPESYIDSQSKNAWRRYRSDEAAYWRRARRHKMYSQINIKPEKLKLTSMSTDLHAMKGPKALVAGVLSQHLILALAAASPAPPIILSSDNAIRNITVPFDSCGTISGKCNATVSSKLIKTMSK